MRIAPRLGISFIPGAIVTFLLLVLMVTLILTGSQEMQEEERRKIGDIFQPEREVTERRERDKPDRPDEPDEPPPDMPQDQEDFSAPEGALTMGAPQFGADLGGPGDFARDSDYIPVYVPQPQFPRRAQTRGVGGYAVVEVIITRTGAVRDPELLEEHPEGYGFGRAALRAAERLRYNPRVVDGEAQEVPGVLYRFTFQIE